jgi:hypothetical protein
MKKQTSAKPQNLDETVENIVSVIKEFQASMAVHLPPLEKEVNYLIAQKSKDEHAIEHLLDTLVSLTTAGIGERLFIRLLEYYKTINAEGAADYWQIFEEMNE